MTRLGRWLNLWLSTAALPPTSKRAKTPNCKRAFLELLRLEDRLCMDSSAIPQGITHFVVIYQENWSFDSLYGDFPGANGIDDASPESLNQVDRLGTPYSSQLRSNNFIRISSAAPQLRTPPQPIKIRMSAQPKLTVDS